MSREEVGDMARDNRGAETGNGRRRAAEQYRLLAKGRYQPDRPVVRQARRT